MTGLKVSTELVAVIGTIVLAASGVAGWFVFSGAEEALHAQVQTQLEAERHSRVRLVATYFQRFDAQLRIGAKLLVTQFALRDMPDAIRALPAQLRRTAETGSIDQERLRAFYDNEVRARLTAASIPCRGADAYLDMPAPAPELLLQSLYVAQNPHPIGQKSRLQSLASSSDYDWLHAMFHPIANGWEAFAYPDVMLVVIDGTVLYSCIKEIDFATNLRTGPFRESGLARVFTRAVSGDADTVHFVDYQAYEPSLGAPAGFGATPVFDTATKALLGVLVFQVGITEVNSLIADRSIRRECPDHVVVVKRSWAAACAHRLRRVLHAVVHASGTQ